MAIYESNIPARGLATGVPEFHLAKTEKARLGNEKSVYAAQFGIINNTFSDPFNEDLSRNRFKLLSKLREQLCTPGTTGSAIAFVSSHIHFFSCSERNTEERNAGQSRF